MRSVKLLVKILFLAGIFLVVSAAFMRSALKSKNSTLGSENNNQSQSSSTEKTFATQTSPPLQKEPAVSAAGAYSLDGEKIYAFRTDKRWPIASITKLMTALVAHRLMMPNETVIVTKEAVESYGDSGKFSPGEQFTVDDLIKSMLLTSSNDAATAIAIHYGEIQFTEEMNKLAALLGMNDTTFVDSTGLSYQNLSTVDDLDKLVRFIWLNQPEIFAISREPESAISELSSGKQRKLYNINLFAGRKDFLGGKTGQTPAAEGNLVSIFTVPYWNAPVVIIILGSNDRFRATEKLLKKI